MNALTIALLSVLGTILLGALAAGAVWAYRRSRIEATEGRRLTGELAQALAVHSKSIEQYSTLLGEASAALKDLPRLVEGFGKMSAAQVVELNILRKEIKTLRESIFRRDDVRTVDVPDDMEKDFTWRAQQIVSEVPGLSMAEAIERVVSEEARKITSPGGFDLG